MKGVDILAAFELEINKINNALEKPLTDDSLYWLNQAVVKFVKDRFNGNAPKRTSYEQNEKRTRDLINLLRESILVDYDHLFDYVDENLVYDPKRQDFEDIDTDNEVAQWYEVYNDDGSKEYIRHIDVYAYGHKYTKQQSVAILNKNTSHPSYDEYEHTYPKDMMYVLNEDVIINSPDGKYPMDTCVFECTADSFMYRVNNKLTDFHYRFHRARPLRVRTRNGFRLLTDKKYIIQSYTLGYLKVPTEITSEDPYEEYTDFEDHTWLEIIKIAAQMYVENQSDPRYKTLTNEVLTQE